MCMEKTLRQSLFWDIDPSTLDEQRHARYIIERILDFGTDEEVRWMYGAYPHALIRNVVEHSRVLQAPTKRLWETLLVK